jgi:hypothetical protein
VLQSNYESKSSAGELSRLHYPIYVVVGHQQIGLPCGMETKTE